MLSKRYHFDCALIDIIPCESHKKIEKLPWETVKVKYKIHIH